MNAQPRLDSHPLRSVPPAAVSRSTRSRSQTKRSDSSAACERTLLEQLPFIRRTVGALARRYALSPSDAEDFESQVKLKLLANDFAILRKFEGKSLLTTFLTAVIQNQFRDYRIRQWGKWRPSAAAKRLGDLGVQLEALLFRDGFNRDEAVRMLAARGDVAASEAELETIAASLLPRTHRRFETDAVLHRLQSSDAGDQKLRDSERAGTRDRVERALRRVIAGLEPVERLILRMRFADGTTIRAIAAAVGVEDRRMYSQLRRLLIEVRRQVENEGVGCEEVLDLLDWSECRFDDLLAHASAEVES